MRTDEHHLNTDETHRLIAADKVEGTTVYNREGKKLGTVENVMIDKLSGKVAYAVLSFGGFLGMGEKHHPLPWSLLEYDTDKDGYVVNLDKKLLEEAPSYTDAEEIDLADENWGQRIHSYYNTPPYWQ